MFLKLSLISFVAFITQASAALNYYMSILDNSNRQVFAASGLPSPLDYAISINEFDFDTSQTYTIGSGGTTGSGAGKVAFNPLSISRPVDQYTPVLFKNSASGTPFRTVTVYVARSAGGTTSQTIFQKYIFSLSAVATISIASSDTVTETSTFQYGGLEIDYTPILASGATGPTVQQGWNRVSNAPCTGTSCYPSS